jgi:hypothetical protein
LALIREGCALGLFFTVYSPEDLDRLDSAKRKELANAIREVLQTDPDVQRLLREKTSDKFDELLRRR